MRDMTLQKRRQQRAVERARFGLSQGALNRGGRYPLYHAPFVPSRAAPSVALRAPSLPRQPRLLIFVESGPRRWHHSYHSRRDAFKVSFFSGPEQLARKKTIPLLCAFRYCFTCTAMTIFLTKRCVRRQNV